MPFEDVTWTDDVATGAFLLPVDMPATVTAGDILLAAVSGPGHELAPSGWTADAFSAVRDLTLYHKVADGSEGGTTVNFGDNSIGVGEGFLAGVARYTFDTAYADIDTKTYSDEEWSASPTIFTAPAVGDLTGLYQVKGYFVMKQGAQSYVFAGQLGTDRGSVTRHGIDGSGSWFTLMLFDYAELTGDQTAESPVVTATFDASAGTPSPAVSYRFRDAASLEPAPPALPADDIVTRRVTKRRLTAKEMPYYLDTGLVNRGL